MRPHQRSQAIVIMSKLMNSRSDRWCLLGGIWTGIASVGLFGMMALVNPSIKIPVMDTMLQNLAEQAQANREQTLSQTIPTTDLNDGFAESVPVAISLESLLDAESLAVAPDSEAELVVNERPITDPNAELLPPQKFPSIPLWVYLAIAVSCGTGSLILTFFLKGLTSYYHTQSRQPSVNLQANNLVVTNGQLTPGTKPVTPAFPPQDL